MYTLESLKGINESYDREYQLQEFDVMRVNSIIEKMNSFDKSIPQIGDIIICKNPERPEILYENGHLQDKSIYDQPGLHYICTEPSAPHINIHDGEIYLKACGGYWVAAENPQLKHIGTRIKTFWTFGSVGERKNSRILLKVEVNVWEYESKNFY